MKRIKKYIQIIMALAMLLPVGCQDKEVIDSNESGTGKLQFSPTLGEAHTATRAGESDNSVLKAASAAGGTSSHIAIETYTGTPGNSLKRFFSDELGYFTPGNYWDLNSGKVRFLPSGGMNLYSYFATNIDNQGDLDSIKYIHPAAATDYPKLEFTADTLDQVDLIAAKVEGITSPNVLIAFRHILSQINFGVKGMNEHQITVKNIRINKVRGNGTFDYGTWLWTPDANTAAPYYPYYFPDRKKGEARSGLGDNYKTQGTPDDSQNSYFFGDGGKFGPGKDATFLYAQVDPSTSPYATQGDTLHNSLMLLPQEITKNTDATVTFDYEIKNGDQLVRSGEKSVVSLNDYYDWEPNFRYVYLFKFDDPQKVTFDVIVEPWQNYNGGDGIVGTDELNSANLFNKYVRTLKSGGSYSVPIGPLTSNFDCDWSLYTLDNSFPQGAKFTLYFDEVPFRYGKSVIIKPPFGFTAIPSTITEKGYVEFAAIHSYFTTTDEVNSAIGSSGNYEFSVKDEVKLEGIHFIGSTKAESSLTLHYLTSYGETPPDKWQMYDDKTAVCFPQDYARVGNTYTIYTIDALHAVLNWMDKGEANSVGGSTSLTYKERMQTNINLSKVGNYDLAKVYKSSAADNIKPEYVPIGRSDTEPYTGTFNGNGATVSNLFINTTKWTGRDGFFGQITNTVQFLHLTNVSVTSSDYNVAGLVGQNNGMIRGCSVSGTIQGGTNTGGIVGQNGATIYSSYSTASITGGNSGGVAGHNGGTIQACYSINNNVNIMGAGSTDYVKTCFYVATSDISNLANVTRVPSIAALNGKIPLLNAEGAAQFTGAHFVSGNLNATPPSIVAGNPATRAKGGVLKGTFIQNWFALNWNATQWDTEMALLASIGMEYLVIDQVMECYVPDSKDPPASPKYMSWYAPASNVIVNQPTLTIENSTALEMCMKACRAHGIKLYIGTFFDKRYWDDGAAVKKSEAEWKKCITTANNVMDDLVDKYFDGSPVDYSDVLAGWYFPYEVDDYNFKTPEAQTILKDGIKLAMIHRNGLANTAARKPYLFSPFMNGSGPSATKGAMSATDYATLWKSIISSANGFQSGDILSPQDCIGIGKLTLDDLDTWMPALKGAISGGVEFWINVELFGPGGNTSFLTGQQIPRSKKYTDKFFSFSYPIHYSPNSGSKQGDHNAYKVYYDAQ